MREPFDQEKSKLRCASCRKCFAPEEGAIQLAAFGGWFHAACLKDYDVVVEEDRDAREMTLIGKFLTLSCPHSPHVWYQSRKEASEAAAEATNGARFGVMTLVEHRMYATACVERKAGSLFVASLRGVIRIVPKNEKLEHDDSECAHVVLMESSLWGCTDRSGVVLEAKRQLRRAFEKDSIERYSALHLFEVVERHVPPSQAVSAEVFEIQETT